MNESKPTRPHSTTGQVRISLSLYAAAEPTLQLLVLLGTASRGDAGGSADLELGYIAEKGFDTQTFKALASTVVNLPNIVLADLRHAPTTAFRAAREGALVFERTPQAFAEFREWAIHNWCDLAPVINAAYDRIESSGPVKS